MTNDEQRKAPVLRFKGFHDDWEQRKLNDIVTFYGGLTYHPEDVQVNGTFVIRSSNIKNNQIVKKDTVKVNPNIVNVFNVNKNDIIVVVRNGSKSLIGKHARITEEMPNTVIGAFMTGVRSNNNKFINAVFDSSLFKKEIFKDLGATINQITNKDFKNMKFFFPVKDEQKNLGDLISKIDKLIILQQRKLKLIKLFEQSYFKQIFLDSHFFNINFGNILKNEPLKEYITKRNVINGKFPIIEQGENPYYGRSNLEPFKDFKKIILFGDHTLSLFKPESPFLVATDGIKAIYSNKFSVDFLYLLLWNFMPPSEGYKRHFNILKHTQIKYPVSKDKQNLLASQFEHLESQSKLLNQKQTKMKKLKQFLLQNMFI